MPKTHVPFSYRTQIRFLLTLGIIAGFKIFGQTLVYDTLKTKIQPLKKINTKAGEYAPFKYQNNFYFISDRENDFAVMYYDNSNSNQFSDLYKCDFLDTLDFTLPEVISKQIRTRFYIGPSCETSSGYYCTVNNEKVSRKNREMPLQINFIEKDLKGKVKHPKKISFGLHDTVSCAQPTVIGDSLMFFASDLENGFGKIDLFYSVKREGKWQIPVNCGPKVNSQYNESFPFMVNSTLYFASDRPNGFGGLDIYKIDFFNKKAELKLLNNPINTTSDDFGIFLDSIQSSGYFSSNRSGNDDIYYFKNITPDFNNCKEMKNNIYCYTFFEESSLSDKDTTGLTYEWSFGDGSKQRGLKVRHCFKGAGTYLVELNVIDKKTGALFFNEVNYEFELKNVKQIYIHCPDTIKTSSEIVFDPNYTNLDSVEIKKYFWDFGDGFFSFEQKPKHTYLKDGYYTVTLGLKGTKGEAAYKDCATKKVKVSSSIAENIYSFNPPVIQIPPPDYEQMFKDSMAVYDKKFYEFLLKKEREDSLAKVQQNITKTKTSLPADSINTEPIVEKNDPDAKISNVFNYNEKDNSVTFKVHLGMSEQPFDLTDSVFKGLSPISETKIGNVYHYFYGVTKSLSDIVPYYEKSKSEGFKSSIVSIFKFDSLIKNSNLRYQYFLVKDTLRKIVYPPKDSLAAANNTTVTNTTSAQTTTTTTVETKNKNTETKNTNQIAETKNNTTEPVTKNNMETKTKNQTSEAKNNSTTENTNTTSGGGEDFTYRVQIGAYRNKKSTAFFKSTGEAIEAKPENEIYTYVTREFKTLDQARSVKADFLTKGYSDAFVTVYRNGKRVPMSEIRSIPALSIYFELNSFTVLQNELDKINSYFTKNSNRTFSAITLEGNTCSLGSTTYNYELSKKRVSEVEKAIQTFTKAGILPKYFGEEKPLYDNSKESTRKLNRRVDIIIK